VNTHENLSNQIRLCISDDGYIRLSVMALQSVHLIHLDSGLYDEAVKQTDVFDKACSILGYTEWVTETEPAISIGWDWTIEYYENPPRYKMVGFPFSNIMLQDASERDMEDDAGIRHIAAYIDQTNWRDKLKVAITNKYS
jgi:hypothetical protein